MKPLKFGDKNNGWADHRNSADFALTLMDPGKDRAHCWKICFLLLDAQGKRERFTFSFPAIAVENARVVRDGLRQAVEKNLIHGIDDWRRACVSIRRQMIEQGWVISVRGGLAVRPEEKT